MKSIAKYVESYGFFRVAFQEAVVLMAFFSLYFTKGYSLYFADFDFSLNRVESLLLGMATAIAIPLLVETNPRFRGGVGVFIETVLTLEFMCFYLFAQYHFWVAAVLIVGAVVGLFLLTRYSAGRCLNRSPITVGVGQFGNFTVLLITATGANTAFRTHSGAGRGLGYIPTAISMVLGFHSPLFGFFTIGAGTGFYARCRTGSGGFQVPLSVLMLAGTAGQSQQHYKCQSNDQ